MTLKWEVVVVDCQNFSVIGHWWAEALGWDIMRENEKELELRNPDSAGPTLVFLNVPETKTVKNRLHFDFVPDDQDAEVERLVALGARPINIGQGDVSWVVMADPEDNEFCVLSAD